MLRILFLALFGTCLLLPAVAAADPPGIEPAGPPIKVMILGTWHFGSPGLDVANMASVDVTTPRRQAELQRLADALARFRPTKIMVERVVETPGLADPGYGSFVPAQLKTDHSETVQIGYRLARQLGLPRVEGIDEQPGPGEPDYFPFDRLQAWAMANGGQTALDRINGGFRARLSEFETVQARQSIAVALAWLNNPNVAAADQRGYYAYLRFGDGRAQPGADLNGMYYLRNAKIFSKLMMASQPGDRVLLVYGAGHPFWLRHFAAITPGYKLVDPLPYLRLAQRRN